MRVLSKVLVLSYLCSVVCSVVCTALCTVYACNCMCTKVSNNLHVRVHVALFVHVYGRTSYGNRYFRTSTFESTQIKYESTFVQHSCTLVHVPSYNAVLYFRKYFRTLYFRKYFRTFVVYTPTNPDLKITSSEH
jgi:hypothetical protein